MKEIKPTQQIALKVHNKKSILGYIMKKGPVSRADLSTCLNLTKPTISKNVLELMEDGYVIEIGKGTNAVGKKGILIDINKDMENFLIINLAGKIFSLFIYNLKSEKIYDISIDIPKVEELSKILNETYITLKNREILKRCILSIPVAVHKKNVIAGNKAYVEAYICIRDFCEKENIELIIQNDIDLQGEYLLEKFSEDVMEFILIGANYGIGSSVFVNRKLYQGRNKLAGEIGRLNPRFAKGELENLEDRCSFGGMIRRYKKESGQILNYKTFQKEVANGNVKLNGYIDEMVEELSMAIYNMSIFTDITTIICVGTLFDLRKDIIEKIQTNIKHISHNDIKVSKSDEVTSSVDGALLIAKREILKL